MSWCYLEYVSFLDVQSVFIKFLSFFVQIFFLLRILSLLLGIPLCPWWYAWEGAIDLWGSDQFFFSTFFYFAFSFFSRQITFIDLSSCWLILSCASSNLLWPPLVNLSFLSLCWYTLFGEEPLSYIPSSSVLCSLNTLTMADNVTVYEVWHRRSLRDSFYELLFSCVRAILSWFFVYHKLLLKLDTLDNIKLPHWVLDSPLPHGFLLLLLLQFVCLVTFLD